MKNQSVGLNRALFQCKTFDSGSLGVLSAIYHRFTDPGDYDLLVTTGGQVARRLHVHVAKDDAPEQADLDLAASDSGGCSCGDKQHGLRIRAGGSVCFYAGTGSRTFAIEAHSRDAKGTQTVLDTSKGLDAGSAFSATLVRPGRYQATLGHAKGSVDIHVEMPDPKAKKAPQGDAPLVRVTKEGFDTEKLVVGVGGTVFFSLECPARVRAELVKAEHDEEELWARKRKD